MRQMRNDADNARIFANISMRMGKIWHMTFPYSEPPHDTYVQFIYKRINGIEGRSLTGQACSGMYVNIYDVQTEHQG